MRTIVLAAALAVASQFGLASAADLARRGQLGLALNTADGSLVVTDVLNPALKAVQKDDVLVAVDGKPVKSIGDIGAILAGRRGGAAVALGLTRGGQPLDVAGTVMEAAWPTLDGKRLELGSVSLETGARVRTIALKPKSEALTRNGLAPAVLMIGGVTCQTAEVFSISDHPDVRLYRMLIEAGFAVFAVDKPGIGDSEGEPCARGGFDVEVEAYSKAAATLAQRPGIDPKRLFAIGLSMGGVQAPLVAKAVPLRGIVTWGPAVMPWYDYLLESFRYRGVLRGDEAVAAEKVMRAWRQVLAAAFVDDLTRDQIAARLPEALKIAEAEVGPLDEIGGRALRFHKECDRANVVAAWQAYQGSLLALHGEYDWVSEDFDHKLAAVIVNARHPGAATFEILPGLDHAGTTHPDLATSFEKLGEGEPSDAFNTRAAAWLTAQAKG